MNQLLWKVPQKKKTSQAWWQWAYNSSIQEAEAEKSLVRRQPGQLR